MTEPTSDAWEDEGFGGENDWAAESVESDLEEEEPLEGAVEPSDLDPAELDHAPGDDDEQ